MSDSAYNNITSMIELPSSLTAAIAVKYGPVHAPSLTRTHSFVADEKNEGDRAMDDGPPPTYPSLSVVVCARNRMPPRPVYDMEPKRTSSDATHWTLMITASPPDVDYDMAIAYESIPIDLRKLSTHTPAPCDRVVANRPRRCFTALTMWGGLLCHSPDRRVAKVMASIAMLDMHMPLDNPCAALRILMTDALARRRWLGSVDSERILV